MSLISKFWTIALTGVGVVGFSQAPEFSQQYKQRLGGGIQELSTIVEQFDEDAEKLGLDRNAALDALNFSSEEFPRLRGQSMSEAIGRYENLVAQRQLLERANPVMQPVHVLRYADEKILTGTFEDYKPAVPTNLEGGIWAGLGASVFLVLARLPIFMTRRRRKQMREMKEEELALEELKNRQAKLNLAVDNTKK